MPLTTDQWTTLLVFERFLGNNKEGMPEEVQQYFSRVIAELKEKK